MATTRQVQAGWRSEEEEREKINKRWLKLNALKSGSLVKNLH